MTGGAPRSRHDRYVLSVDLGTGGPKVGLVSLTGAIAVSEHLPVTTRLGPGGEASQDAEEWWQLVRSAARRALGSGVVPTEAVVAVSCTGQWASTVPVDDAGRPVGECLLWLDTRGGPMVRRRIGGPVAGYAPLTAARWVRHTGGAPSTSGADPVGHILFLEEQRPEVARAARWYLEPVDYLTMRFCGTASATPASMAGAWLTDNRCPEVLAYDPVLVRAAGIPGDKLAPLRPTGGVVGTVSPGVASDLGLPPDVAVVTGTPDLHSACVGSGAVLGRQAHVAISTTSWVSCPFPRKKTDPFRQIATVPGIVPGLGLVANNQDSAGRAFEWLRDLLTDDCDQPTFDDLTALAALAPPGSGSTLFTPWLAGERSPVDDRAARGGFHNLTLQTTRAEMVRAVMEGVAFNSRWLLEAVERFVGRRLPTIRAIGGGARSSLWCSIYAGILDRPVEQVAEPSLANLRGSALIAGMALGQVRADEIRALVPVQEVHLPETGARDIYQRLFEEVPALYTAQKGLFRRLNRSPR
ncbi:MAG: xylulokinase [Acidimicrobiales bacterium]